MKFKLILPILGIAAVTMLSGCHKKAASAAPPPPPAPTREAPPASTGGERATTATRNTTPAPETTAGAPTTSKALEDYLNKLLDAYFDYDKADLRSDAQTALNNDSTELRSLLQQFPNTKFVVEGNCDERGSAEYNLALGERRARAAKEFLTQIGVPGERLSTISYGQERPVCSDHNEGCWQKNRRAHLSVAN